MAAGLLDEFDRSVDGNGRPVRKVNAEVLEPALTADASAFLIGHGEVKRDGVAPAWRAHEHNVAITDRLFVSTRTVEGHLYRVYAKLGVHDRRAFARLLHHSEDEPRQNQPAWRGVIEPRISEIHVR